LGGCESGVGRRVLFLGGLKKAYVVSFGDFASAGG
jgi:hypothetical protein